MIRVVVLGIAVVSAVCGVLEADDSLETWEFWPRTRRQVRPTGRRKQISDSFEGKEGPFLGGGVTRPCLVDAFTRERAHAGCNQGYGSVLWNFTDISIHSRALREVLQFIPREVPALSHRDLAAAELVRAVRFDLRYTDDSGGTQLAMEMSDGGGLRFWNPVNLGSMFFLELEAAASSPPLVHRAAVAQTKAGHHTVFQYYAFPAITAARGPPPALPLSLTCMTFNVWNVNPPSYLYRDPEARWQRYSSRLDQLAQVVRSTNPDIIALQEVRHDDLFGPPNQPRASSSSSQIRHIVDRLPGYQYVYHPAMMYLSRERGGTVREEEGPAILSRFPILNARHLLLPRDVHDGEDEHQRACLHAQVLVEGWGVVDVYSTHFSLSEKGRDRSVGSILDLMHQGEGSLQVLMGDLNAEPQERAMRFLRGEADIGGHTGDLRDAWLDLHPEPKPGSTDPWEVKHALTFPSCNPVKRIDYIYWRQGPPAGPSRKVELKSCDVRGQDPTVETQGYHREGLGMLDMDSPVWASDHRAVVSTFELS